MEILFFLILVVLIWIGIMLRLIVKSVHKQEPSMFLFDPNFPIYSKNQIEESSIEAANESERRHKLLESYQDRKTSLSNEELKDIELANINEDSSEKIWMLMISANYKVINGADYEKTRLEFGNKINKALHAPIDIIVKHQK